MTIDPRAAAILDEQIAALEQLIAGLKQFREQDMTLVDAGLSTRICHQFRCDAGYHGWTPPIRLSHLATLTDAEILRTPNIGRLSLRQIRTVLHAAGYEPPSS